MQRYFIYLAYNGTNYCGWQNQPNGISIQQKLEEVLHTFLRKPAPVTGAGRTDAGVHARLMVAHFDWEEDVIARATARSNPAPLPRPLSTGRGELDCSSSFAMTGESLTEKLNCLLPKDISIFKIIPVIPEAHARFDALSRTYNYYICREKDPFKYPFQYRMNSLPDFEKMNEAAAILPEYTDFTSFSKLHTDVMTNNCKIKRAEWKQEGTDWVFTIQADRFLRNMVRAIVGTLLEVGRGKLSMDGFRQVIESKDRGKAGTSMPGNALFLVDIEYPASIFIAN